MRSKIDIIQKKGYKIFGNNLGICAMLLMVGIILTKASFTTNSIYIRIIGIIFISVSIINLIYSISRSRKNMK